MPESLRNAHALDSQAGDLVELLSGAAKTGIYRARIRADSLPANLAAEPLALTRLRRKTAVAHDVDARLSKVVAPGPGACLVLDGSHHSSVAALKIRCFTHDFMCLQATDQQRTGSTARP